MKKLFIYSLLFICSIQIFAKEKNNAKFTTVTVVVDPQTYGNVRNTIDSFVQSLDITDSRNKLLRKGVLLIDKWNNPDSIRNALFSHFNNNSLEGAIFIGDIPIPMIRDAHHLTTAFKMSPKRDWKESSVPSDRFYDDFKLKFDFIKKDTLVNSYYYYSLRADSPQKIKCDIYSGRIKPPQVPGKDKYQLINDYLLKCIDYKKDIASISNVLYFAGHGYNSESLNARIDETPALYEQFPQLKSKRGCDLEYIDYTFDNYIKNRLMSSLAKKDIDLAVLHHHGGDDAQYLNGSPLTTNPSEWLDLARNFFRSKIRRAKDTTQSKAYYMKEYDVPASWVDNTFDPRMTEKDSLHAASMDITIPDMYGYVSNAKMILLDACFNGSYHLDDYISAYYIFNPGNTMVVKANSVNTLQDTWTNELLGLLNYGICAGNWTKGQMTLESHLIGDPTFAFAPAYGNIVDWEKLNSEITLRKGDTKFWRELLNSDIPSMKCLAIKMLSNNNSISSKELLSILESNPSDIVRLESFMRLKERADKELVPAIILAMTDSYELLQRLGTLVAAKNSSPELAPYAAKIALNPLTSKRIEFQNKYLMDNLDASLLISEFEKQRPQMENSAVQLWATDAKHNARKRSIQRNYDNKTKEFNALKDSSATAKEKNFTISGQRNLCDPRALAGFYYLLQDNSDATEDMKVAIAESMGWYTYSYIKEDIIKICETLYQTEKSPRVKNELLKTINRLK